MPLLHCRYGIMGLGAVCHNLNPRLFVADLEYIINHGKDVLFKGKRTWIRDKYPVPATAV